MANTAWSGAQYPIGTASYDIPARFLEMANSVDKMLVPTFNTTSDRDAAGAAFTAAHQNVICYVKNQGVSVFNGSVWEWVGNTTPVEYASGTGLGPQFTLSPTWANWTTATYTFTPTRTGWADIGYDFDVQKLNVGFGAGYLRAKLDPGGGNPGVLLGDVTVIFDVNARASGQWRSWQRRKLVAGQTTTLSIDASSFQATPGTYQWQVNNLVWHVVQQ